MVQDGRSMQQEQADRLAEKLRRELGPICDYLAEPNVIEVMLFFGAEPPRDRDEDLRALLLG